MIAMHRYRAIIEYDGTDFLGYQYQKTGRTVQGEIEKSLKKVAQTEKRILGAGRTDAGVHATGQVIAFDAQWKHTLADLQRALNATLAEDIAIRDLKIVDKDFHPRFDALSRSYCYTIISQPWPSALQRRYVHHVRESLDVAVMNEASHYLVGSHDFASFGKPPQGNNTIRQVLQAEWTGKEGRITFTVTANAFLYRMVRRLVGTLIKVGLGQLGPYDVKEILVARDLSYSAELAPACGLCLVKVTYPA
jgi:tRNA pseudouridine38-40 synthase